MLLILMDYMDIFRLNWIYIDTIIIILLVFLLILVKFFKATHRWRNRFSNLALARSKFKLPVNTLTTHNFKLKDWQLAKDSSLNRAKSLTPTVLIIRTGFKKKLQQILIEGLSTYGINVVDLRLKRLTSNKDIERNSKPKIKNFLTQIHEILKNEDPTLNPQLLIMPYLKSNIAYESIILDKENPAIVLVNPKIDDQSIKHLLKAEEQSGLQQPFHIVISKKSFLFMKNRNFNVLKQEFPNFKSVNLNVNVMENARNSFKDHETILLGILIKLIEQ